jgi:hypothetical protein
MTMHPFSRADPEGPPHGDHDTLGAQSVAELTRLTEEAGLLTESKPTFPKGL